MSMLGELFGSLGSMSQFQLLLAFVASGAYACAQGHLLSARGKFGTWALAIGAAVGFVVECPDWTLGTVMLGVGVVGMGIFAAVVWLLSRLLGVGAEPSVGGVPQGAMDSSSPVLAETRARGPQATGPAHFV